MMIPVLGRGLYTVPEAARLVRTSPRQLGAWFYGWSRGAGPLTHSDYDAPGMPRRLISFLDLIDSLVVLELRRQGISLQRLRKVRDALACELQMAHPFCLQNLYTVGKQVFIETADRYGDNALKELVKNQFAFKAILGPQLHAIKYARETLTAMRWHPHPGVVVDPQRQYGKPIVESVGVPTAILMASYTANDRNSRLVADWFGISARNVEVAVTFERRWSGEAA